MQGRGIHGEMNWHAGQIAAVAARQDHLAEAAGWLSYGASRKA